MPAGTAGGACSSATELRCRSVTSRRITTSAPSASDERCSVASVRCGDAGRVHEREHRQVATAVGSRIIADHHVPALGDGAAVVVADQAEERSADQVVDRSPGQRCRPGVGRHDHSVLVEPHHRLGQVVEQLAEFGPRPRQLLDRATHPAPEVSSLDQRRHDGHDRHDPDRDECARLSLHGSPR